MAVIKPNIAPMAEAVLSNFINTPICYFKHYNTPFVVCQNVFNDGSNLAINSRSRWCAGLRPRITSRTSYCQAAPANSRNALHIAQFLFSHLARLTCFCQRILTERTYACPCATVKPTYESPVSTHVTLYSTWFRSDRFFLNVI